MTDLVKDGFQRDYSSEPENMFYRTLVYRESQILKLWLLKGHNQYPDRAEEIIAGGLEKVNILIEMIV